MKRPDEAIVFLEQLFDSIDGVLGYVDRLENENAHQARLLEILQKSQADSIESTKECIGLAIGAALKPMLEV